MKRLNLEMDSGCGTAKLPSVLGTDRARLRKSRGAGGWNPDTEVARVARLLQMLP